MKTQFLIPLTLTTWLFSTLIQSLPLENHIDKRNNLPSFIPSRIQPASVIPPYNLSLEQEAGRPNGPIPKNTPNINGFALELPHHEKLSKNNNDKRSNDTISTKVDTGVSIASQEQVNSAYFFAELSANAYCRQVVPLGIWFCPHCKSSVSDAKIEKTFFSLLSDTNGYIITSASQKAIFLAFRGTNSIRSAITDLNFVLSAYPPIKGAKVHPGFYNSYIEVQKTVLNTMDSLLKKYPGYRVDVTGHSLGGAQAELATLDLFQRFQQLTPDNLRLYTVGQPRVGNPNYAAYFLSTKIGKIRTVHESDLVPHLPPMASGYLHTGTEYWVKDDDTKLTQICEATFESASCSNTLVPFLSILDHLSCYNINEGLCL